MAFLLTGRQEQRRAISTKLHTVFAENTQRGNVLPSGTMGKYVRQNQHTICRLGESQNDEQLNGDGG